MLAHACELLVVPRPGEIDIFRPHCLRVVMSEHRCVLVTTFPCLLEPFGEPSMQASPLCDEEASVGHIAGECVLDRKFWLADNRRARPRAYEVAFLENVQVRFDAFQQLGDGTSPERSADHGGCLEGRLFRRLQQVDARREDSLHRVGNDEIVGKLPHRPVAVVSLQHALVDQRANELLDEEWIALGTREDDVAHGRRQRCRYQLLDHVGCVGRSQRVERTLSASRSSLTQSGRV